VNDYSCKPCNNGGTVAITDGNPITMGMSFFDGEPSLFLDGDLDDVRIYNIALSAKEIATFAP
jgi:hypothetical protein